jgi:hypothetical protein
LAINLSVDDARLGMGGLLARPVSGFTTLDRARQPRGGLRMPV